MFTIVSGVLLRPLPIQDESRVVRLDEFDARTGGALKVSMTDFFDWKPRLRSFTRLALYELSQGNLLSRGYPERVRIMATDTNVLPVLGVAPAFGRSFSPDQCEPNRADEILLTWSYWKSRFGGAEDILGRQLVIDQKAYTVIGVLPRSLFLFGEEQVWIPLSIDFSETRNKRGQHSYYALARLKPGVPLERANYELKSAAAALATQYPRENKTVSARVRDFRESITGEYKPAILMLFGFVAAVLMIACANVASLAFARAARRQPEMSIREAIGATRARLFQQVLTESLLLSFVSTAAGVALSVLIIRVVTHLAMLRIPLVENVQLDWRVLFFSAVLALLTGVGFGLAPALGRPHSSVRASLQKSIARSTESRSQHNLKRLIIFLQAAIATLLLIISGLLLTSFEKALRIRPGFDTRNLLTLHISLPLSRDDVLHPGKVSLFVRTTLKRISQIPGVDEVAISSEIPLTGIGGGGGVLVEGETQTSAYNAPYAFLSQVSPGYFETLRIPIVRGRGFDERDRADQPPVAIVNEAFVRTTLHGSHALSKRIMTAADLTRAWQIIGVAADVPQTGIESKAKPQVFFPLDQMESNWLAILVRVQGNPMAYVAAIRREVQKTDPSIAVFLSRTMTQIIKQQRGWRSFETTLVTTFALISILMAGLGTYAVISYSIAQRVTEIGIRMALGATGTDIRRRFTLLGALPAVAGAVFGVACGFMVAKLSATLLYGVQPTDLTSYGVAAATLVVVAFAASWIPARRAASLEPLQALRYE